MPLAWYEITCWRNLAASLCETATLGLRTTTHISSSSELAFAPVYSVLSCAVQPRWSRTVIEGARADLSMPAEAGLARSMGAATAAVPAACTTWRRPMSMDIMGEKAAAEPTRASATVRPIIVRVGRSWGRSLCIYYYQEEKLGVCHQTRHIR